MKLLMIGMDGASYSGFQRGWTPFISSLIKNQINYQPYNNLLSRGWLEIATGMTANLTGAMYDKPMANGSREWTVDFAFGDIKKECSKCPSIWEELNNMGFKVGIMNLPTTFPAPKVNGFFVSGGGGGGPVTESATPDLCYPEGIDRKLNDIGYIVDQRLYQLVVDKKKNSAEKIFKQLSLKNSRRTEGFIELNREFDVDFGFIVYKTSSVFAETFYNTELNRRNANPADTKTEKAIENYYRAFDGEIKKLREEYPDSDLVFVSDHGTECRRFSVNPNVLLKKYQLFEPSLNKGIKKALVEHFKSKVPFWIKYFLKKTLSKKIRTIGAFSFEESKTQAFTKTLGDWRHGIYLNDSQRFGGPVHPSERKGLAEKICDLINNDKSAIQHKISASVSMCDKEHPGNWYPDIIMHLPDGYLTSDKEDQFISKYIVPSSNSALSSITEGEILSLKSHHPLFVSTVRVDELLHQDNVSLTNAYDLVMTFFRENGDER